MARNPLPMWQEAPPFQIVGSQWLAEHAADSIVGPTRLQQGQYDLLTGLHCTLGQTDDSRALVDSIRQFRRNNAEVIAGKGRLPYGNEVKISHTHRYADGLIRLVSDFHFPAGTKLLGDVAIGSFTAVGEWEACTLLHLDGDSLVESERPIGTQNLGQPVACVLRRANGQWLEFGCGNDLWRWQEGVGACQPASMCLEPADDGLRVVRTICSPLPEHEGCIIPARPNYRFASYLAWGQAQACVPAPAEAQPIPLTPDGKPDRELFAIRCQQATTLQLDVRHLPWKDAQRRTSDGSPCFAAKSTVSRIKTLIRRLKPCLQRPVTLRIAGLQPGCCQNGGHIDRRGGRAHWDHSSLHELSLWIQQHLRDHTVELADAGGLPSRQAWFRSLEADDGI